MSLDSTLFIPRLRELHVLLRDALHQHLSQTSLEEMSAPARYEGGDTIFTLDSKGEDVLVPYCENWGKQTPFLMVCEGFPEGRLLFGTNEVSSAQFILICDPIDGTRPLMYDKRSAWLLLGIAPNLGAETNLSHIEVALQGELPNSRAGWADVLWGAKGRGVRGESYNLYTQETRQVRARPSGSKSIEGGFATLAKFFPGSKGWIANLEEQLITQVLGEAKDGQPLTFDDQYISTGGQFYELLTGRDRFNGDLRPFAHRVLHGKESNKLCVHPYDVCTELLAREVGVIITDEFGQPLACPLDVESPVTWLGYANESIRQQIEPTLLKLLHG